MKKAFVLVLALLLSLVSACGGKEQKVDTGKPIAAKKAKVRSGKVKVFVRITGLFALKEMRPATSSTDLPPLELYMLNASADAHHPHRSVIVYDVKYRAGNPFDHRGVNAVNSKVYFPLLGEKLTFQGSEDDALSYGIDPVSCADLNTNSIRWIPKMRDVAKDLPGGAPDIADFDRTRFFTNVPSPARIAAVLDLSHGTITAKAATPIVWEFKTAAGSSDATVRQPVAEEMTWIFEIDSDFLIIESRRFNPPGSLSVPLVRLNADENDEIHLTLANVEENDIPVLTQGAARLKDTVDQHYMKYYDLFLDQSVKKRLPIAYGICVRGEEKVGNTDEIRCLMRKYVDFKDDPPTCDDPPPAGAGGVNCIPTYVP